MNNTFELESPHRSVHRMVEHRDNTGFLRADLAGRDVEISACLSLSTRVRFVENLFSVENTALRDVYATHGRCVAVVDSTVDTHHGGRIAEYFATHGVAFEKTAFRATEADKGLRTVESVLEHLNSVRPPLSRNEPVLVVGGGVLHDVVGMACSLLHRGTPYVMVSTSVIAAVDAGPSPRTGVNARGLKNSFGTFHPPLITFVDRTLFSTLATSYVRHGAAEIVKMGVVDDRTIFELLESFGAAMVESHFAAQGTDDLAAATDEVLFRTVLSYLKHEGTNVYEVYEDRPHAYGHTWSNRFEMTAGLLHGHAVSIEMCLSACLATLLGWLDETHTDRILNLCHSLGLALYHPVLEDIPLLLEAQEGVRQKRGGRGLYIPLPKPVIGECDYLAELPEKLLADAVMTHRKKCAEYPDSGAGQDAFLDGDLRAAKETRAKTNLCR